MNDTDADKTRRAKNAAYMRGWLSKNKDRVNAANRERRRDDPVYREAARAWARASIAKNPEKNRKRAAKWQKENRERYLERQRGYTKANPQRYRDRVKQWKKDNPEQVKINAIEYQHRRRVRQLAGGKMENCKTIMAYWRTQAGFRCYLCGVRFPVSRLEVDHFIPLGKGGSHTPENLRQACGPCNRSKGDRVPYNYAS